MLTEIEPSFKESRFEGWCLIKNFVKEESLALGSGVSYTFKVMNFTHRFLIPSVIALESFKHEPDPICNGASQKNCLHFSDGDRYFGVHRFPRDNNGEFFDVQTKDKFKKLYEDSLKANNGEEYKKIYDEALINIKDLQTPLVFEAFKIPQFTFEFVDIDGEDTKKLKEILSEKEYFSLSLQFEEVMKTLVFEVQEKIKNLPNYLLILKNTLNKKLTNFDEISQMTNGIIHI